MIHLPKILPEPKLPSNLPPSAKWLSGEGAGSWFVIEKEYGMHYKVERYSPEGLPECEGLFSSTSINIDLEKDYELTYPSHCAKVSIMQSNEKIILKQQIQNI